MFLFCFTWVLKLGFEVDAEETGSQICWWIPFLFVKFFLEWMWKVFLQVTKKGLISYKFKWVEG